MNKQERRIRNLKVGAILGFVFVAIFTITTIGFVIGFEASPPLKKIVSLTTTIIAGVIGFLLIGAAIYETVVGIIRRFSKDES